MSATKAILNSFKGFIIIPGKWETSAALHLARHCIISGQDLYGTDCLFRREELDCVPTEHFIILEWGKQWEDCVRLDGNAKQWVVSPV